jgi:L-alanine-DL-glutamate epimerase-like enolase superfamily enzyme
MVDLVMVGRMTSYRIASVEGIVVRAPRSPEQSRDEDPSGEALIVIVRTTSGLAGFGECNHHPRAAHAFLTHDGDHSMGRGMGPLLIGRDCRDVAQIGAELYRSNLFAARRGIGWAVQAALDCALWDLAAGVQILQPWVNRLGVTGTLDVIEQARSAGRQVILAGWNATSIGVALGVHLAAGLPADSIVLEHAPCSIYGFPLRAALGPELVPVKGRFDLPTAPGLGLEIDTTALARFVALKPKD